MNFFSVKSFSPTLFDMTEPVHRKLKILMCVWELRQQVTILRARVIFKFHAQATTLQTNVFMCYQLES